MSKYPDYPYEVVIQPSIQKYKAITAWLKTRSKSEYTVCSFQEARYAFKNASTATAFKLTFGGNDSD